jgi:hypothetical protein
VPLDRFLVWQCMKRAVVLPALIATAEWFLGSEYVQRTTAARRITHLLDDRRWDAVMIHVSFSATTARQTMAPA